MRRLLTILVAVVGVVASTGPAAPAVLTQNEITPYLHPQRLVDVGDIGDSPIPPAEMRAIDRAWNAGHDRLARLSSVGVNSVIPHTEHFVQLDRPAVVTTAVAKVVSQTKRRSNLTD